MVFLFISTTGKIEPFISLISFVGFLENQQKIRIFHRPDPANGTYLNFRRPVVGVTKPPQK
jgi:hypothetical protein